MRTALGKYFLIASAAVSLMFLGSSADAQATLSLTPSVAMANSGDIVTFALDLTGGTNLFGYLTSVSVDNTYLSFVGATPFTPTFAGFETEYTNAVNGFGETSGALDINYDTFSGVGVNSTGTTELGTFQVLVNGILPTGGTPVSLAPLVIPSGSMFADPSSVADMDTGANELTSVANATLLPAPEPSAALALLLGAGVLGVAAIRRRRHCAE